MLEVGVSSMPEPDRRLPPSLGLLLHLRHHRRAGEPRHRRRAPGRGRQLYRRGNRPHRGAAPTAGHNDFSVAGGDGYPDLSAKGTTRDVLAADVGDYIAGTGPFAEPGAPLDPTIQGRITCEGEGCPDADHGRIAAT